MNGSFLSSPYYSRDAPPGQWDFSFSFAGKDLLLPVKKQGLSSGKTLSYLKKTAKKLLLDCFDNAIFAYLRLYFFLKRSTRPPASANFCLPV